MGCRHYFATDILYGSPAEALLCLLQGFCYVKYTTPESAAAAIEHLHGVEFPPGSKMCLKVPPEAACHLLCANKLWHMAACPFGCTMHHHQPHSRETQTGHNHPGQQCGRASGERGNMP